MSKAGCPYDNAPMERFYNTLKNEILPISVWGTEKCVITVLFLTYMTAV